MFQYGAARVIALRNEAALLLDPHSGFVRDPYGREFALECFRIAGSVLPYSQQIASLRNSAPSFALREKLGMKVIGKTFYKRIHELQFEGRYALEGYFQSYRYLGGAEDTIRADFTFKMPRISEELGTALGAQTSDDLIAVHVRRQHGLPAPDPVDQDGPFALPPEYYRSAIERLLQSGHVARPHVLVFGDVPKWLLRNVKVPCRATVVSGGLTTGAIEDLALMRQCRYHVISNSSFSWWGAWLCEAAGKIVVAPRSFSPTLGVPYKDIYPRDWWIVG